MERVSFINKTVKGTTLIVAPHGYDDKFTGEIAMATAKRLNCPALVNWTFRKADDFDYDENEADCNNLNHLQEDVVCQEFLDPFLECAHERVNTSGIANIYLIHGMHVAKGDPFDIVLGTGDPDGKSSTCSELHRDGILFALKKVGLRPATARIGGLYAGAARRNLNQTFRTSGVGSKSNAVNSYQLELTRSLRESAEMVEVTADSLARAINIHKGLCSPANTTMSVLKDVPQNWRSMIGKLPSY